MIKLLISWVIVCISVSCNHLFYYPHEKIYLTPDKLKLSFEEILIPVNAGVTLHAWHIKPAKSLPAPVAVIQFHGNAENRSTHFLSVGWLAQEGVDVVVFDYRGYNGSTGTPSRSGLIEDSVAALKWFEHEFPKHRRYAIGQSLGGAVVVPALAKSEVSMDGLVLESVFHSYRGIARMKLSSSWLFWCFQWLPYMVLSGDEDPVDFAPQIKLPVLAFHDRRDPVVPYDSGGILYESFPSGAMKLITDEGASHAAAFAPERVESRNELKRFIGLNR